MIADVDIYRDYADLNRELSTSASGPVPHFSNDTHMEDPALIIGIRKQSYGGLGPPDLEWLGFFVWEHIKVGDKYDIYLYER